MAETSTIFGFMKYVSATDILSDFKKTVDSYFVNSLKLLAKTKSFFLYYSNPIADATIDNTMIATINTIGLTCFFFNNQKHNNVTHIGNCI